MRKDILLRKKEILEWIKKRQPKSFICKQIKCKPETLNFHLKKMGIEYKGNMNYIGIIDPRKRTAKEYIELNAVRGCVLKEKLIEEGYKKHKCESCKKIKWMGALIPLELHHKDGDRFNNNFENLQLICPNCHAQTDNYRRKKSSIKN